MDEKYVRWETGSIYYRKDAQSLVCNKANNDIENEGEPLSFPLPADRPSIGMSPVDNPSTGMFLFQRLPLGNLKYGSCSVLEKYLNRFNTEIEHIDSWR